MAKKFLSLIVLATLLSLAIVGTVSAQSTRPSPPQFTLTLHDNSIIWITIDNQSFNTSSTVNALEYYYRVKDHNSQHWGEDRTYVLQSDTQSTTITVDLFPLFTFVNNASVLDFQVQAVTGYYAVTKKPGPPALISPAPQNWHTEITFNESELSGWSSTQTITLPATYVPETPNPTPPPSIPEVQTAPVWILLLVSIITITTARHQKRKQKEDSPNLQNAGLGYC